MLCLTVHPCPGRRRVFGPGGSLVLWAITPARRCPPPALLGTPSRSPSARSRRASCLRTNPDGKASGKPRAPALRIRLPMAERRVRVSACPERLSVNVRSSK